MFDDDPVDPIKEAMRQHYRNNPGKAFAEHGQAVIIFVVILIVGAIVGSIANLFR
ncbi:hypothetical protein Psta_4466 [Pirellula staleyi DSM 6068]|uniref:Uncharacterized protein n=1 Tax=Pirellula staleyi (strain ATCC 27377 / DSM 6068 / ICPB 4128) TaxID=530564 RepID=D2R625_PIRSD|nr:hypothetical protein [Pirellula staleyi]ADB19110.1 hypothetical protein Psta_4466 [Pirellula staleyi DSM 6068]